MNLSLNGYHWHQIDTVLLSIKPDLNWDFPASFVQYYRARTWMNEHGQKHYWCWIYVEWTRKNKQMHGLSSNQSVFEVACRSILKSDYESSLIITAAGTNLFFDCHSKFNYYQCYLYLISYMIIIIIVNREKNLIYLIWFSIPSTTRHISHQHSLRLYQ